MCSLASLAPMAINPNGLPVAAARVMASRVLGESSPASGKLTGRFRNSARAAISESTSANSDSRALRSEANEGWRHRIRRSTGQVSPRASRSASKDNGFSKNVSRSPAAASTSEVFPLSDRNSPLSTSAWILSRLTSTLCSSPRTASDGKSSAEGTREFT